MLGSALELDRTDRGAACFEGAVASGFSNDPEGEANRPVSEDLAPSTGVLVAVGLSFVLWVLLAWFWDLVAQQS
jgi:hypothetical protein